MKNGKIGAQSDQLGKSACQKKMCKNKNDIHTQCKNVGSLPAFLSLKIDQKKLFND